MRGTIALVGTDAPSRTTSIHRPNNNDRLLQLYRQLEPAYPRAHHIYVVQDNWPIRAHEGLTTYLATVPRITRLWLPIAA